MLCKEEAPHYTTLCCKFFGISLIKTFPVDVFSMQQLRHFVLAVKERYGTTACWSQELLQYGSRHNIWEMPLKWKPRVFFDCSKVLHIFFSFELQSQLVTTTPLHNSFYKYITTKHFWFQWICSPRWDTALRRSEEPYGITDNKRSMCGSSCDHCGKQWPLHRSWPLLTFLQELW